MRHHAIDKSMVVQVFSSPNSWDSTKHDKTDLLDNVGQLFLVPTPVRRIATQFSIEW